MRPEQLDAFARRSQDVSVLEPLIRYKAVPTETLAWLADRIRANDLERIVVAACSPREHEATFRGVLSGAGRSPIVINNFSNRRAEIEKKSRQIYNIIF